MQHRYKDIVGSRRSRVESSLTARGWSRIPAGSKLDGTTRVRRTTVHTEPHRTTGESLAGVFVEMDGLSEHGTRLRQACQNEQTRRNKESGGRADEPRGRRAPPTSFGDADLIAFTGRLATRAYTSSVFVNPPPPGHIG